MCRVELKYPIEIDGKRISAVTIRRPKQKDLKAARGRLAPILTMTNPTGVPDAAELAAIVALTSIITGLSEEVVREFDLVDIGSITITAYMQLGNWAERGAPGVARRH